MSRRGGAFGRVSALALGGTMWLAMAGAARGDALPFDEETTKGANGSTVILGLDRFPAYSVILYPAACISDYEEEAGPELRLGEGSYDYAIVRDGAAVAGADYGSPNCSMGSYFALPIAGFPVVGGRIPALDRRTVTEVDALLYAGEEGVLKAGRGPAPWAELPRRDRRSSFVEFVRAEIDGAGFRLVDVRTTWSRMERAEAPAAGEGGRSGGTTSAGGGGASGGTTGAGGGGASGGTTGAGGGGASGGTTGAGVGGAGGGTTGAGVGGASGGTTGLAGVGGAQVAGGAGVEGRAGAEGVASSQERGWSPWWALGGAAMALGGVLLVRRRGR